MYEALPELLTTIVASAPELSFHAEMVPSSVSKMNEAATPRGEDEIRRSGWLRFP